MKLRESSLPPGWYPQNTAEISRFLSEWNVSEGSSHAVVAPHAGWRYSGKIAARAISSLDRNIDTLVILGGHLPEGYPPLFALEDAVSTPLGNMKINTALRDALFKELDGQEDRFPDNTVEVLLPMARYFFPQASVVWLRLPAEPSSYEAGKAIARCFAEHPTDMGIAVIASTDLTHYGLHYNFTPKGTGPEALRWMKDVNDRNFINAVLSGDHAAVLKRAEHDQSSCSAGAVVGAMGFAAAKGLKPPRLLQYATSADEHPGVESFVGYAAIEMNN